MINQFWFKQNKLCLFSKDHPCHIQDIEKDIVSLGPFSGADAKRCQKLNINENILVIVPGLSFDLFGNRLGYGAGFYDRFLLNHSLKDVIGVGFKEELSFTILPCETHDQKIQEILLF